MHADDEVVHVHDIWERIVEVGAYGMHEIAEADVVKLRLSHVTAFSPSLAIVEKIR
jgi:hypothetical protein